MLETTMTEATTQPAEPVETEQAKAKKKLLLELGEIAETARYAGDPRKPVETLAKAFSEYLMAV